MVQMSHQQCSALPRCPGVLGPALLVTGCAWMAYLQRVTRHVGLSQRQGAAPGADLDRLHLNGCHRVHSLTVLSPSRSRRGMHKRDDQAEA